MILDVQTLDTITSWSVIITGSIFSLYVVIAGCIENKNLDKKNLDLMFTLEKALERES